MRKVLKDRHEVAHFWANKVQSEGRAGNMFFEGDKIYSYGRHYMIARHLADGVYAMSNRGYSSSTGQHTSIVRGAAHHLRMISVWDVDATPGQIVTKAREQVAAVLDKASRARQRKPLYQGQAISIAQNANAYLDAIGSTEPRINIDNLEGIRSEIAAAFEAEKQRQFEAQREEREKAAENLEFWRWCEGFHRPHGLHLLPCALRLRGDEIETSHGAAIPVEAALRLWPVILRVKGGDKDYEPGMKVGYYTLTQIRRDGSIKVGCHDIAFSEIERMAEQLGLMEPA